MESFNSIQKESAAYQPGPLDDVQLQEALTIIAIHAAQMDYKNCKADVKRIEKILEHHPLFVARRKEIFAMINKYVNEMDAGDPDKALAVAVATLTPEQKKTGFDLAVDVALQDKNLTDDKKKILALLERRLSISDGAAKRAIQEKTEIYGMRKAREFHDIRNRLCVFKNLTFFFLQYAKK